MNESRYFILIDSGGTHCRIGMSKNSETIEQTEIHSSLHYTQHGAEKFSEHISGIIYKYLNDNGLKMPDCRAVCIGASGARNPEQKRDISVKIAEKTGIEKIFTESDSAIAYEAYFGNGDGLILVCGTGSVLFGKYKGKDVRIGGWGKLLGDSGSSYSYSLNVLRTVVSEFDNSDEEDEIEKMLGDKYGIRRDNIIREIYQNGFDIASLTPSFLGLAENGNKICIDTARKEVQGAFDLINIFINRFFTGEPVHLAFTGSLAETKNYFSKLLFSRIEDELKGRIKLIKTFRNPLEGALKIALKKI